MKFYIPTSNLNLDNILQSECILPIAHYAQRCSGYNTYEQIEELRSFGSIVLFKYPVQFRINDMGRYNFPVLIEIEDDKQTCDFADNEIQDGVCLCNHRLNLTPKNCRIYFFSESAYNLTLVNTQSNKAIKYFKEYKIYPTTSMLKLVQMPILNKTAEQSETTRFEDTFLDKQKGVLYAFLLGNKMSVDRNLARQLRLTQEMYNILTNLISSPSNYPIFEKNLRTMLDEYKEIDPVENHSIKEFHAHFDNAMGSRFRFLKKPLIEFLKKIDCWDMVFESLCKKWSCSFLPDVSLHSNERDFSMLRNDIERHTSLAVSEYTKSKPNADLNGLHLADDYVLFKDAALVNIVIKYIMSNSITPEKLSANRMGFYMDVMKDIVPIFKNKVGEENWPGSKAQTYVNGLYAYIDDPASPFALNSIDDLELKSIAAFILRGQSIKDCVAYLRLNEIEDYQYTISLWGCLCGYMEMNKDALSMVLSMENYRMVYEKMFGSDLAEIYNNVPSRLKSDVKEMDYELFKFILEAFKIKEVESIIKYLSERKVSEASVEAELDVLLNTKTFKRATAQCKNARMVLQIYLDRNNEGVTEALLDKSGLSKSSQSSILSKLGFVEPKKTRSKKKTSEQTSLFPELGVEQYSSSIDEEYPELECSKDVDAEKKEQLAYWWKVAYEKYPDTKDEFIKYFINLCKKEGRGGSSSSYQALKGYFTQEVADQFEAELKRRYDV